MEAAQFPKQYSVSWRYPSDLHRASHQANKSRSAKCTHLDCISCDGNRGGGSCDNRSGDDGCNSKSTGSHDNDDSGNNGGGGSCNNRSGDDEDSDGCDSNSSGDDDGCTAAAATTATAAQLVRMKMGGYQIRKSMLTVRSRPPTVQSLAPSRQGVARHNHLNAATQRVMTLAL
jgi:hypothetical protein